jgi:hypothetical protein
MDVQNGDDAKSIADTPLLMRGGKTYVPYDLYITNMTVLALLCAFSEEITPHPLALCIKFTLLWCLVTTRAQERR